MYIGLENADALAVIDTNTNTLVATIPIGQAPQAVVYVPDAVPEGPGTSGLVPLGIAAQAMHIPLSAKGVAEARGAAPTSVTLFDQGLIQVLQAAVSGLEPKRAYVLAFSTQSDGGGSLEPLASFTTNPSGSAIVNAIGPIRQILRNDPGAPRRFLVIAPGPEAQIGSAVQVQTE